MSKLLSIPETKQGIIDFLYSRPEYVRHVHGDEDYGGEYRTRCPYCGDSQKELNTGHFYMKLLYKIQVLFLCIALSVIIMEFLQPKDQILWVVQIQILRMDLPF